MHQMFENQQKQIESVGGRFIEVDGMDDFEDEAGYAKPLTPEFIQKVNDTVCGVASDADIIVTTARIFGRPAPITVPSSAVKDFKSGAVVVDMNADVGGNCEDTVAGEVITTENGVIVVGTSNLPGTIATTASMLYSNNLTTFITSLVDDGELSSSQKRMTYSLVLLKEAISMSTEWEVFSFVKMEKCIQSKHDWEVPLNDARIFDWKHYAVRTRYFPWF